MQIIPIDSQTFRANKFSVPIKKLETKWGSIDVDYTKEYSNPKAEELYNKAKKETDIIKKVELLKEMGDYKIIDSGVEKVKKRFLERVLP